MAVSISDRKWIIEANGTRKEKVEFMLDSASDVSLLPDPLRVSASSVAILKPTKETIYIIDGVWFVPAEE
jgi:hypothetical protein